MPHLPRRFSAAGLDPRGPRPRAVTHVLFGVTVFGFLLVRALNTLFIGRLVPPGLPFPDPVYLILSACVLPLCVLWPFTAWERGAPVRRRAATMGFLASSLALFPMMDFGTYALLMISVAAATCAFGVRGGLVQSLAFGVVNALFGLWHPGLPNGYALVNGVLLTGVGLVVLGVLLLLLGFADRARHTGELLAELEKAHEQLRRHAARDRERAISDERARMAREMHDSTGHHLSAVHLCLANAERALADLPEQVPQALREDLRADVGEARRLTKETLADTRRWVRALKPLGLTERSGPDALRSLTEGFGQLGVATSFDVRGEWPQGLDGEAELVAFRCVQEALTNALRHSGADRVEVRVRAASDELDITVADDGRGPGDRMPGFGLTALRERVAALGGTLEAGPGDSGPGDTGQGDLGQGPERAEVGFVLRARIPVTRAWEAGPKEGSNVDTGTAPRGPRPRTEAAR